MRYLFAVFLLVIFLAGCGKAPLTGVAIDRDFNPYIPSDAQVLASIQIEKLKSTGLYKRHLKDLDLPELNALSERLGLDPRRDLTSLLAVWDGKQPVVLVKGTFAPEQLQQKFEALGAKSITYKSYTLFGSPGGYVAFVDRRLAISGPVDALHAALDRKANGEGGVPPEFEQRLASVLKDAQIWEISRGGVPLSAFPARADVQSTLGNFAGAIKETTMGLRCDTGVHFQSDIKCVSQLGGQRVRDALRGLVGLARLTTNTNEMDLLRLWDAIHVDQEEDVVHVRADLSDDLTDKLLAYLPKVKSRAGQLVKPF